MVLPRDAYDKPYYGDDADLKRISGYSEYGRQKQHQDIRAGNKLVYASKGERFKDILGYFIQLTGISAEDRVLELGCAKGFMAEDARALGIYWYGVDVSQWAASRNPALGIIHADATLYVPTLGTGDFDYIVSFRFMECLSDREIAALVPAMNRVGKKQIHVIDEQPNPEYYNVHTLEEYASLFPWKRDTVLYKNETFYSATPKSMVI